MIPNHQPQPSSARHAPLLYVANTTRKILPRSSATRVTNSYPDAGDASKIMILDCVASGDLQEIHQNKSAWPSEEKMRSTHAIFGGDRRRACHDEIVRTSPRLVPSVAPRRRVLGEVARQGQASIVDNFGSGAGKENVPPGHEINQKEVCALVKDDAATTSHAHQQLLALSTVVLANTQKKRWKPAVTLVRYASLQDSVPGVEILRSTITGTARQDVHPPVHHSVSISSQDPDSDTKRKVNSVQENDIPRTGTSALSQSTPTEHEEELLLSWFQSLVLSL